MRAETHKRFEESVQQLAHGNARTYPHKLGVNLSFKIINERQSCNILNGTIFQDRPQTFPEAEVCVYSPLRWDSRVEESRRCSMTT